MTCAPCGERMLGTPRTDAERTQRHYAQFGTTTLPPRGTGLRAPGLTEPEKYALVFIGGAIVSAIFTYIWTKPAAFKAKLKEFK